MSQLIQIDAGKLVGMKTSIFTIFNSEKYDPKAIPNAWREFFTRAKDTDLLSGQTFYGASIPSMSFDEPMSYFAGALVSNDFQDDSFDFVQVPSGTYFTVEHLGPITNIASSYKKAYMDELPNSGKEMRLAPHLEIYNSQLDPMSDDYSMLIAIPVV